MNPVHLKPEQAAFFALIYERRQPEGIVCSWQPDIRPFPWQDRQAEQWLAKFVRWGWLDTLKPMCATVNARTKEVYDAIKAVGQ